MADTFITARRPAPSVRLGPCAPTVPTLQAIHPRPPRGPAAVARHRLAAPSGLLQGQVLGIGAGCRRPTSSMTLNALRIARWPEAGANRGAGSRPRSCAAATIDSAISAAVLPQPHGGIGASPARTASCRTTSRCPIGHAASHESGFGIHIVPTHARGVANPRHRFRPVRADASISRLQFGAVQPCTMKAQRRILAHQTSPSRQSTGDGPRSLAHRVNRQDGSRDVLGW